MREAVRRTVLRTATLGLRKTLGLPDPVLRRIVGGPVRIDGDELSATAQLLIKVERLFQRDEPPLVENIARARREFDLVSSTMLAGSEPSVTTRDTMVAGAQGLLRARIYLPPGATGAESTLVYFHGGGFVLGSVDSHDGVCRFLCRHGDVRVISVEYRLAPENPYPAAVDDAIAAFRHVATHSERFGATPGAIGIGGDSAGAAIAAVAAHVCVQEQTVAPEFSLLLYPVTDGVGGHPSRRLFRQGYFLDAEMIAWYQSHYAPDPALLIHPRMSPLRAEDFTGLPPTCVVTGGFDPFRDEGEDYANRLRRDGVAVTRLHYGGLVHGFGSFLSTDSHARRAMHGVAGALRRMANPGQPGADHAEPGQPGAEADIGS